MAGQNFALEDINDIYVSGSQLGEIVTFKPGQLIIWYWKGVPQFLAIVTHQDGKGVHYKRLVAFEDYKTPLDGPGAWVSNAGLKELEIIQ